MFYDMVVGIHAGRVEVGEPRRIGQWIAVYTHV
jgi:hypothetical protein